MSEALRLANDLDRGWAYKTECAQAAAELRRLAGVEAQRDELLELLVALRRIAMASEATVCNQEWVAKTARAAIAKAEQEN